MRNTAQPNLLPQNKKADQVELCNRTRTATITLLKQREATTGEVWSDDQRIRAQLYLEHLLTRHPIRLQIPEDVKAAVHEALQQACEQTGFTPPKPQPAKTKKRKKR